MRLSEITMHVLKQGTLCVYVCVSEVVSELKLHCYHFIVCMSAYKNAALCSAAGICNYFAWHGFEHINFEFFLMQV